MKYQLTKASCRTDMKSPTAEPKDVVKGTVQIERVGDEVRKRSQLSENNHHESQANPTLNFRIEREKTGSRAREGHYPPRITASQRTWGSASRNSLVEYLTCIVDPVARNPHHGRRSCKGALRWAAVGNVPSCSHIELCCSRGASPRG